MKLYLSGPMSNYPQFNIPAFERAAESLRALGHEVIVPYELDNDDGVGGAARASENGDVAAFTALTGFTWGDLLARDIKLIADGKIEGIVVLPDWENSKGARLEAYIGLSANLPIFKAPNSAVFTGSLLRIPDQAVAQQLIQQWS